VGPRNRELEQLLDDDPVAFTVAQWRARNVALYATLIARKLVDPALVSERAHEALTLRLLDEDNPAATDPQNAGHVRAQNENILHYALSLGAAPEVTTVALVAGFIHDLNKAVGEPLRQDRYAVRGPDGQPVETARTTAHSVGLNHLGERTRAALVAATRLGRGKLTAETARHLDDCIVHHGLGSSVFIRRLLDGDNAWWGKEFVDARRGLRKVVHPPPPRRTLASVLHDLADSTQQMQGGVAWLFKYPTGFWRESGRALGHMLSERAPAPGQGIAMSLRDQLEAETETCRGIIGEAELEGLVDEAGGARLLAALAAATRRTRLWIDDSPATLARARAPTVYHDVGAALGISARAAHTRLGRARAPTPEGRVLLEHVWASARAQDVRRTRDLAALIARG